MGLNDTCLFCGEIIPEGRQVCPICEKGAVDPLSTSKCLFKKVYRGDVFMADLNPVVGSETGGVHPIIIIQNNAGNKSGPTIIAAIGTSAKKPHLPVHVCLKAGIGGLSKDTIVQLEQIRTLDKRRLKQYIGHLGKGKKNTNSYSKVVMIENMRILYVSTNSGECSCLRTLPIIS